VSENIKTQILISNDDGVHAPGITHLATSLSELADIIVVAPDRDRSAASNSLTLDQPLRVIKQPNGFYSVTGTPTDSVHIAITGWLDSHPDMIVSGINCGANLGDDVLYSGTVAAAMEGRFLGYPAIAISLVCDHRERQYFETAAVIAKQVVAKAIAGGLSKKTILNVNVPNLPLEQIKGFKVTRLGYRHIAEQIVPSQDPRGNQIFWIGPAGVEQDGGPGTDFHAIKSGYVSITPIKVDLTDFEMMDKIVNWSNGLVFSL
jgi:5'-nucleotidase